MPIFKKNESNSAKNRPIRALLYSAPSRIFDNFVLDKPDSISATLFVIVYAYALLSIK